MIQEEETVSIKIPAGVEEGMQLKASGRMMHPEMGLPVTWLSWLKKHHTMILCPKGNTCTTTFTFHSLSLEKGVAREVNLLDGKVRIKLESGIQSGKTLFTR